MKLSGTWISASLSSRRRSIGTEVSTGGLALRSSSPVAEVVTVGSSYSPFSIFSRSSLSAEDISVWRVLEISSTSSRPITPSSISFSA